MLVALDASASVSLIVLIGPKDIVLLKVVIEIWKKFLGLFNLNETQRVSRYY